MAIRYNRLSSGDVMDFDLVKWTKSRLPVTFLRQQMVLVSLVVMSALLFLFTSLFTSDVDYNVIQSFSSDINYGIIVDCGSSGTRAHIFKWKNDPHIGRIELVELNGIPMSKHITPGLSSLKDDPDKASDYMEPLMTFISESIPSERHFDTPIYFMATAGLRLLDESIQRKILTDINTDLVAKYDFPHIKSQVISGAYEGVYSWLSLNMNKMIYNTSNNSKTYGMIEMGGASTQVTFELTPKIEQEILRNLKDNDAISSFKYEQVTLNLGLNKSVRLFATTFLGLGVNKAREAAIDLLLKDYLKGAGTTDFNTNTAKKFKPHLKDPCLTMGSNEVILRPTELLLESDHNIGHIIHKDASFEVHLEGSGNFLNCLSLLERTLMTVKAERYNCEAGRPCPMSLLGTDFIPFSHYQFIGLSEMFFTTNEMINSAGLFSRSKILHETQRICSTDYNKLLEMYSNSGVSFQDRILYECFKASWLLTILHSHGLNMPSNYDNFATAERWDGHEIDWTMGAIIKEVALGDHIK